MAEKRVLLTQAGYDELVKKLDYLKSVRRLEVADRLKTAIALGDLSENSEYDDAKNEQALLEGEILELEAKIANSEIIQSGLGGDKIDIGSTVVVHEIEEVAGKTYGQVKNAYKIVDGEPKELDSADAIYRIIENESFDIDGEKIYKLANVTVEEVTASESGENVYRLIEGGLVQLNETGSEVSGKVYKLSEGDADDIYGRVERIYKVYQVVDDDEEYRIVGSTETNPDEGKISDESPLGTALVGKKIGDIAEVHAPVGVILYEIVKIN